MSVMFKPKYPAPAARARPASRAPRRARRPRDLLPVQALAQTTSALVLSVFAIVNFALVQLKRKGDRPAPWVFSVPVWAPWAGLVTCLGLLSTSLL